jgi:heme/copper-type cytochrome/quinol oxidase subunit 3
MKEKKSLVPLGLWAYLLTDAVLFASFFATFFVLTATMPLPKEYVDSPFVFYETLLLLSSSFFVALAHHFIRIEKKKEFLFFMALTLLFGLTFVGLEIYEFIELNAIDAWKKSASSSVFFALVGLHGLHIVVGLLWGILLLQFKQPLHSRKEKMISFSMYWHFLDLIWLFIVALVYLVGKVRLQ